MTSACFALCSQCSVRGRFAHDDEYVFAVLNNRPSPNTPPYLLLTFVNSRLVVCRHEAQAEGQDSAPWPGHAHRVGREQRPRTRTRLPCLVSLRLTLFLCVLAVLRVSRHRVKLHLHLVSVSASVAHRVLFRVCFTGPRRAASTLPTNSTRSATASRRFKLPQRPNITHGKRAGCFAYLCVCVCCFVFADLQLRRSLLLSHYREL